MTSSKVTKLTNHELLTGNYVFDNVNSSKISINKEQNVTLYINNFNNLDNLDISLRKSSFLKLLILSKDKLLNFKLKCELDEGSKMEVYFGDFTNGETNISADIRLKDQNAECLWNLSSLAKSNFSKNINVSISHMSPYTYSLINNYGVSRDNSRILFSGVSHILKGSEKSKAHQNAKIMVFDDVSNGIAKPILKIDENDIEASHAAIVGKISDDQLFYLCSRGLTLNQARELVTYGYLKPIINGFDDIQKEEINKLIEESF